MSSMVKMLLLLAVVVCISKAQLHESRQCLCQRVRNVFMFRSGIKDIQIYQNTIFCNKVEIVVTMDSGLRLCLNPNLKAVKKLLAHVLNKQKSSTSSPARMSSTPGSSSTAHM
uniref:Chemokine interleukin-8-like domain-containing protein n=1 Tax=Mola mola TaxID=94237 RepID=A0A3Q3W660_MOLML